MFVQSEYIQYKSIKMKIQIGYYNEQGTYIEELVDVIEKTNEQLIQEKEAQLLALYDELKILKGE